MIQNLDNYNGQGIRKTESWLKTLNIIQGIPDILHGKNSCAMVVSASVTDRQMAFDDFIWADPLGRVCFLA